MTTINDILKYFETIAPLDTAKDFDNVGLLVGDKNTVVTKVLVALDITEEVVLEAEKMGCELIISHHPVIFNALKKLKTSSVPYMLASKGIAAVCMHTNLDLGTEFGVNVCLAKAVGATDVKLCSIGECLFEGTLKEETTIEAFAKQVKETLGCNGLRYTDINKTVKKIAISSGAGGSNFAEAAEIGADVLLTGEIKHHEILTANALGINIIDTGHFKSEDIVILPLCARLLAQFSDIKFTKSTTCDDKIKFI